MVICYRLRGRQSNSLDGYLACLVAQLVMVFVYIAWHPSKRNKRPGPVINILPFVCRCALSLGWVHSPVPGSRLRANPGSRNQRLVVAPKLPWGVGRYVRYRYNTSACIRP